MDALRSLITKIAWDYYINNYTQQEIANHLNISRLKVTRYLQKARDMGLVKISIALDGDFSFEKEEQLKRLLDVSRVTLVPSAARDEDTDNSIGVAGAQRLNQMLTADDILGVAWGRTLYAVARNLSAVRRKGDERVQVVQLMGGLTVSDKINPEEIVKMFTERLDAKGFMMNVPAVVTSREARDILLSDRSVAPIFAKAQACNVCLLGLGDLSETSSLFASGAYSREELAELKACGAVGDILGRPYDRNGQAIENRITDRIMAIPLAQISQIDKRIAVVAGSDKVASIIGAARGALINELITDEKTADEIIRTLQHGLA